MFGGLLLYARHELFDPDSLENHAASTLEDESVRMAIAPAIVTAISRVSPGGGPTEQQVVKALADPRVAGAFGASAAAATQRLFGNGSGDLHLDLAKVSQLTIATTSDTSLSELGIPPSALGSARLDLIQARAVLDALKALEQVSKLGFVLVPLGLLAMILSIFLAPDGARGLSWAALALAVGAGIMFLTLYVGREVVIAQFHDDLTRNAVSDAWGAVLGGLRNGLLITAAASGIVALGAGAAASRREPAW